MNVDGIADVCRRCGVAVVRVGKKMFGPDGAEHSHPWGRRRPPWQPRNHESDTVAVEVLDEDPKDCGRWFNAAGEFLALVRS